MTAIDLCHREALSEGVCLRLQCLTPVPGAPVPASSACGPLPQGAGSVLLPPTGTQSAGAAWHLSPRPALPARPLGHCPADSSAHGQFQVCSQGPAGSRVSEQVPRRQAQTPGGGEAPVGTRVVHTTRPSAHWGWGAGRVLRGLEGEGACCEPPGKWWSQPRRGACTRVTAGRRHRLLAWTGRSAREDGVPYGLAAPLWGSDGDPRAAGS